MNFRTWHFLVLAISLFLLAPAPRIASAAVVVDDDFDAVGATPGDDPFDPLDVAWIDPNGGTTFSISGGQMRNQSGATFRWMEGAFDEQPIGQEGSFIRLSVDLRTANVSGINSVDDDDGYRVGLFSSDNRGYFVNIAAGDDASDLSLLKDDGTDTILMGSSGFTQLATVGVGAPTIDDGDLRNFDLLLQRQAAGVLVTLDFNNGANTLSFLDTTSPIQTFSIITGGTGNHPIDFFVDNVLVEAVVVPEPAAATLVLGGLVAIYASRRRRRRAES